MSLLIRPIQIDDAPSRARLWQESGRFFAKINPDTAQEPGTDGLVAWLEEVIATVVNDETALALVAEIDGELAGALTARLLTPIASASRQVQRDFGRVRVHVDALSVAGVHRRAGVGTALMAAAERWAMDKGAEVMTLETDINNPTSMPFYEHRMGYTPREVIFRKAISQSARGSDE